MSRPLAAIKMEMCARRSGRRNRAEIMILRALARGEPVTIMCESEEEAQYWGKRIKSQLLRMEKMI